MTQSEVSTAPPSPSPEIEPAPRRLSPATIKRTWGEPVVRATLVLAGALALATAYLTAAGLLRWKAESDLIAQPPIQATIVQGGEQTILGRPVPLDAPVRVSFAWKGQRTTQPGWLTGMTNANKAAVGDRIPIHVDPDNEANWSAVSEPPRIGLALAGGALGSLFAVLAVILAWLLRRRVLNVLRNGEPVTATVLSFNQSPLAPRSRVGRCVRSDGDDRRIFTVYLPRQNPAAPGGTVVVLIPPGGGKAMHAGWLS